jgi:hypothetical protein|tara:strand:- start:50 stop:1576 length:1527 start_codon:yes stop_codon:yes gene_type:complete
MADLFQLESTADVAAGASGPRLGTDLNTGVLRRKFNFGDRVSELNIAQDPFFRMMSKLAKKPTDDPEFKFTERRPSFHKRYAYVSGWVENDGTEVVGGSAGDADLTAYNDGAAPTSMSQGDTIKLYMATDYKNSGNRGSVYGQSTDAVAVGASGTRPAFFLPGQVVKVPVSSTDGGGAAVDHILAKITKVTDSLTKDSREVVQIDCSVVRVPTVSGADYLAGWSSDDVDTQVYDESISSSLESKRTFVIGSAHAQGTGYPETWKDQPFSTGYGRTQIWKTSMAMDNTTRATVLKYEPNEWARTWREKLIEHKYDIEQSCLFGAQYDGDESYTQGAVDYISSYGNVFSLTHASKTQDDFLDDMSNFLDPRYNNANATIFFCDTATYNWLHKLSGYFSNNLEVSSNFRADMSLSGKKKVFGVEITTISTPYGDMNVARNIHLDQHPIKLLAVNMKYCAYRPLVGNGLNRDTAVYVGVQTLENSGVDRRVDLIQTEAGMEWQMPEAHAYWS